MVTARAAISLMDLTEHFKATAPRGAAAAFAAGDYVTAALEGRPGQWQYHAARGIIVDPLLAARELAEFESPEACFHRAVCAWMGGDDDLACQLLEQLADQHARNLLALIRRPRIDVLAQMPPMRSGPFGLLDGIVADRKFNVRNLGTAAGDVRMRPYASVHEFYEPSSPPAFYVCSMVEWNDIPIDIGELPCATIGCTSDFDAHIASVAPWLRALDVMLTCDHMVEWNAVRAISGQPAYAYPMMFGAARDLPLLTSRPRDLDVFMSGTMLSPYQPDKARLVHRLGRIPDIKLLLLDGHIGFAEYFELLSRAKITPSFCRHPGAMLTRTIEALAMGSITLVPQGSPHQLWGGEDEGVFVYDERVGPEPEITRILTDYVRYGEGCVRNAGRIRDAFRSETVAARFFRFCTVAAARPRAARDSARHRFLTHKRQIFIRGPRVELEYAKALCDTNLERFRSLDMQEPSPRWPNEMARELILLYGQINYYNHPPAGMEHLYRRSLDHLEDGIKRYPDALILHANLVRLLARFGDPEQRRQALILAQKVVDRPAAEWQVDAWDDIYPYDFCGNSLDARDYFDAVVLRLAGIVDGRERLRDIILAALHYHLAVGSRQVAHARAAVGLDAEFPFYRLLLAELLMQEPAPDAVQEVRALLLDLTRDSMVSYRAYVQLRALEERQGKHETADVKALQALFGHLERSLLAHEQHYEKLNSRFLLRDRPGGEPDWGLETRRRAPMRPGIRISALVCGEAGYRCAPVIEALARQTLPRQHYEIIYADCYDRPTGAAFELADAVVCCDQDFYFSYRQPALNRALAQASGEIVVVVEPGCQPEQTDLAAIERAFNGAHGRLQRRVVIGRASDAGIGYPGFCAFMLQDALMLGNFDEHQVYAGRLGSAYELSERLCRTGVPCFAFADGRELNPTEPTPWLALAQKAGYACVIALASVIFRELPHTHRVSALRPRIILPRQRAFNWASSYRKILMRVAMAREAAAEKLEESNSPAAALALGMGMILKPIAARCLPQAAYRRLAEWCRAKLSR